MEKKTFEISNIQSVDELNHLSHQLNNQEQVSHIKIGKDTIVFHCIDIDALLKTIQDVRKKYVVKEVVDGVVRKYNFAKKKETTHYFMFKNILVEDDVYVLIQHLKEYSRYRDIEYDAKNKVLTFVSDQRDVYTWLKRELFKINPSLELIEYHKPIRSQDVFNQKYLSRYIRVCLFLIAMALAVILSKDDNHITPLLWYVTMFLLAEPILVRAWKDVKHMRFFKEDVLVLIGFLLGIAAGAYIETCIAIVLYQFAAPLLNKVLERSLLKIDTAVAMPETGIRVVDQKEEEISLYDFEVGHIMMVKPGETVHIPGVIQDGQSQLNTYSNTSTYNLIDAKAGMKVSSGDINAGEAPLYIETEATYESSRYIELMNIASVAPIYESKIEKLIKKLVRLYTPAMIGLGLFLGVVLPIYDFYAYSSYIHVGAILMILAGSLSSEQSTSLGVLAGFAKAFQDGIVVESSLGLDSINACQTIVYDRFDGVEVNEEELELFRKLACMGRVLVIFNDGPVALEDDQYTIYNNLTVEEKLAKMDSLTGPIVYIGDSFKDIKLLQKSYVGISRGGLADAKVVENSDIVLLNADLNKVYETFLIARHMRSTVIFNNGFTIFIKTFLLVTAMSLTALPLWSVVLLELVMAMAVMYNSTRILE